MRVVLRFGLPMACKTSDIKLNKLITHSTGKGTSGKDKFSSKVHRVDMELGGKLLNSEN